MRETRNIISGAWPDLTQSLHNFSAGLINSTVSHMVYIFLQEFYLKDIRMISQIIFQWIPLKCGKKFYLINENIDPEKNSNHQQL